jgi:AraC-like DNA-binding protein
VPDNFKYLTHNPEDKSWGIYLTVAGYARVAPESIYPPHGHPAGYNFNWLKGRILHEYQINYITQGEGIMETRDGTFPVSEGSIILLKPNLWHRYKPLSKTGWTEHYLGFNGDIADSMIKSSSLLNELPVIQIGFHELLINVFQDIFNYIKSEKPGYHQVCSGLVIHILGQIISINKNKDFQNNVGKTVQKSCLMIRDNLSANMNIEQMASELNINYSVFRKAFKQYTGLSPMQYHTSLRMKQALYLLANSELSIKEISFNLGFCSVFYFSKLFKEKTGISPGLYRRKRDINPPS